jgi:DNA-binding protein YbaB
MFDKVRDIYRLQKQAKQIKKELANIHIEAEEQGVVVTVNGEMQVVKVVLPDGMERSAMETALVIATNKGIKKAQEIAAEKMKAVMGDMQGLMGGGDGAAAA